MINLIDTVKLRLNIQSKQQLNDLIQWIEDNYSESYEKIDKGDGSERYRCEIKNMKISIDYNYLFITGSIHKFYIGNNVDEMHKKDIIKALDLINSYLGSIIDIKQANVRRLDFGMNLLMKHQATAYVSKLFDSSSKKPTCYNGQTINFGNKSRGIKVYDKTAEVKKRDKQNTNVPDNLIRLKAFIHENGRKVFEKHFGSQLPTMKHIIQNLGKLPDIWLDEYKRLSKAYTVSLDRVHSQKELFQFAIVTSGYDKCYNVIEHSYDLGLISKMDRSRWKDTVKTAFERSTSTADDDLMKELDEKVMFWYNKAKQDN